MSGKRIIQLVIMTVAIFLSAFILWRLASTDELQKQPNERNVALVETVKVSLYDKQPLIKANGVVQPSRVIQLRPQVSGKIVWLNPQLVSGGVVTAGEALFRIEEKDYTIAVAQAEAAVAQAQAQLSIELGRVDIAEEEWEYFKERNPEAESGNRDLALREPQLAAARARTMDAESLLQQAQLNLKRTTVISPFDAVIVEQSAALGKIVSPETPVATLVERNTFDVHVRMAARKLPFIDHDKEGVAAYIYLSIGESQYQYKGHVAKLVPAVNPEGRMARLIVSVPNPLSQRPKQPLLLYTFVTVTIESNLEGEFIAVPREAVHFGDQVHIYQNEKLKIVKPEIVWRLPDVILVSDKLNAGDQVITTQLPAPLDGMPVRKADASDETAKESAE